MPCSALESGQVSSQLTLKHGEIVLFLAATVHDGKTCGRSLSRSRPSAGSKMDVCVGLIFLSSQAAIEVPLVLLVEDSALVAPDILHVRARPFLERYDI
ncbi:hypothetical protein SPRG_16345 [Saprolegnia parasitica CBS 223.65]|uniref:Uncharacterized protein n=1 Tax=Saprolegnia parasitica (strain CBS 223.65) TaxID=695850 RepID=A0A067BIP2_SAPPC|nr:hypothetical protein SPRG_16345 [Saprolegnia parasitica CBS 223.65]KDO18254.1 hypothetical protein SPRG_16345 [Saprolegnia parasitica CBS 223.65]|eukprot:XP_012211037.1 hypothetical protein SPRG_16345 [Saprolegnia parasitica CBS 223.65]